MNIIPHISTPLFYIAVSRLRPSGFKSPDLRKNQRKSGDLPPQGRSLQTTPNPGGERPKMDYGYINKYMSLITHILLYWSVLFNSGGTISLIDTREYWKRRLTKSPFLMCTHAPATILKSLCW